MTEETKNQPDYETLLKEEQDAAEQAKREHDAEQSAIMKQLALEGLELPAEAIADFMAILPDGDADTIESAVHTVKGFMAPQWADPQVAAGPRRAPKSGRPNYDDMARDMYNRIKHRIFKQQL